MNRYEFKERLFSALVHSAKGDSISLPSFLKEWFDVSGQSYYFAFSKTLGTTNVQMAEIAALLRRHAVDRRPDRKPCHIQFVTRVVFQQKLTELLGTVFSGQPLRAIAESTVDVFGDLLGRTIVLEPLFSSCVVSLPFHLQLDVARVCALSGYIRSCGELIYMCPATEASAAELCASMKSHASNTDRFPMATRPFVLDGQGNFGIAESAADDVLSPIPSALKPVVEKCFFGRMRLVDLPSFVGEQLKDEFVCFARWLRPLPGPEDERDSSVDWTSSVHLVMDRSVGEDCEKPGTERHYICFDAQYVNTNAFHLFDENKPGWWSPTTMPHSLAGAMINLTAPLWPMGKVNLGEPFAGSGTTPLEALKFEELLCRGSDWAEIAELAAADNLSVFTRTSGELTAMIEELGQVLGAIGLPVASGGAVGAEAKIVQRLLGESFLKGNLFEASISKKVVTELRDLTLGARLAFYVGLRCVVRHATELRHGMLPDHEGPFKVEGNQIVGQLKRLQKLREGEEAAEGCARDSVHRSMGQVCLAVTMTWCDRMRSQTQALVSHRNARKLEKDRYDLIVTDPPYGFNTELDSVELAELYHSVLERLIRGLRKNGQLVLCLPERSYTGRAMPRYAGAAFVTDEVEACCRRLGRDVCVVSQGGLASWALLRPPYYWEADRALRRSILHFRILDGPALQPPKGRTRPNKRQRGKPVAGAAACS